MSERVINFSRIDILEHIDKCIDYWRNQKVCVQTERVNNLIESNCDCYIDAYQSMRMSLFGSLKQT